MSISQSTVSAMIQACTEGNQDQLWRALAMHVEEICESEVSVKHAVAQFANTTDQSGVSGLLHASISSRLDVVQSLLKMKADPNVVNERGEAPIHAAVSNNNMSMCKSLLDARGNADVKTNAGSWTPLMLAVQENQILLACNLIRWGADPRKTNHWTTTAIDLAAMNKKMVNGKLQPDEEATEALLFAVNQVAEPYQELCALFSFPTAETQVCLKSLPRAMAMVLCDAPLMHLVMSFTAGLECADYLTQRRIAEAKRSAPTSPSSAGSRPTSPSNAGSRPTSPSNRSPKGEATSPVPWHSPLETERTDSDPGTCELVQIG